MNSMYKSLALWLLLIVSFLVLYNLFHVREQRVERLTYSSFMTAVEAGEVARVELQEREIHGQMKDARKFDTYSPEDVDLVPMLREKGVEIDAKPPAVEPLWKSILISWFPMLLFIGLWVMMLRQMQAGNGRAMSFGKSRAKLLHENANKVKFEDVAGVDEAKDELMETVEFLRDPQKYTKFGGRIPKGVLLVGSPGTGKTLLARAVAGEADVPFFSISGSDFVEMFVGVGASRVRDLFGQAKKSAPCIIFIDEIDAVGRHRGAGLGGGHDEREQTLNQLLVEMDGFEANNGVIMIAATNRPDVLDPALLRPGRFDRRVVVPLPDWKGRKAILQVHVEKKKVPVSADVDLDKVARSSPGFTGADLENIVNEAALVAARTEGREGVTMSDFDYAKDKVMMGAERRSIVISEEEKKITAYHEAGHALVAKLMPQSDPVHKVTIIPRGMALGLTQQLPEGDKHTYSSRYLNSVLTVLMGGRAAEELIFQERTTGAGNDIERATNLAQKMVCDWGMSERIGPLGLGRSDHEVFLGRDIVQTKDLSDNTAQAVDEEIKRLVTEAYDRALQLLRDNIEWLHAIVKALLEKETISGQDIDVLMGREAGNGMEPSSGEPGLISGQPSVPATA